MYFFHKKRLVFHSPGLSQGVVVNFENQNKLGINGFGTFSSHFLFFSIPSNRLFFTRHKLEHLEGRWGCLNVVSMFLPHSPGTFVPTSLQPTVEVGKFLLFLLASLQSPPASWASAIFELLLSFWWWRIFSWETPEYFYYLHSPGPRQSTSLLTFFFFSSRMSPMN